MAKLKDKHCFTIEITLEDNQESLTQEEIEEFLIDLKYYFNAEETLNNLYNIKTKNVDYKYILKCYGSQS